MIISAYVYEPGFAGLRPGDADRLTHINIAFALVKEGKASVAHWKDQDAIRDFVKNKGHLKMILSVGGWGAGGFSPAVATPEARETLAESLIAIADDYGFDGIDMDWEYPCDDTAGIEASPLDKPNFTAFMQLLRQKLGPDKILSMAAGGTEKCAQNLQLPQLMEVMDFINLMTYDMCPWDSVNHHTALFTSEVGNSSCHDIAALYEQAGVPRDRITIGAGFYARIYKDVDGIGKVANEIPGFIAGGYAGIFDKVAQDDIKYDEKAEAPYVYDAKSREFITFDNPRSLAAKMEYVRKTGLAGVMFWEYYCDDENSILLKALTGV